MIIKIDFQETEQALSGIKSLAMTLSFAAETMERDGGSKGDLSMSLYLLTMMIGDFEDQLSEQLKEVKSRLDS